MSTRELLGLVASLVLRCDDCITFHLTRCVREDASNDELFDTFSVAPWSAAPRAAVLVNACL